MSPMMFMYLAGSTIAGCLCFVMGFLFIAHPSGAYTLYGLPFIISALVVTPFVLWCCAQHSRCGTGAHNRQN